MAPHLNHHVVSILFVSSLQSGLVCFHNPISLPVVCNTCFLFIQWSQVFQNFVYNLLCQSKWPK